MDKKALKQIPLSSYTGTSSLFYAHTIFDRQESAGLHYHDSYQVCYVKTGSKIYHQHGSSMIELLPGDVFIVPPYFDHDVHYEMPGSTVHALHFHEKLYTNGRGLSMAEEAIAKFIAALMLDSRDEDRPEIRLKVHMDPQQQRVYENLFNCLESEIASAAPAELSATQCIVNALLMVLLRAYSQQDCGRTQLRRVEENERLIKECIAYIDQHYRENLSLQGVTKRFAISKTNFTFFFPIFSGMTFKQYVAEKRIQQAKELLAVSALSVTEISQLVGYVDFSTFYRNFKKYTGMNPNQYRQKML